MLLDQTRSLLLVVDIQQKLLPAVSAPERLIANSAWLIRVANTCQIPLVFSEQYPQGLGHTISELRQLAADAPVVAKQAFSCIAANCLPALLLAPRQQIVLIGMETHVCVLQTAIELQQQGKQVFVVADAVSSRSEADCELALARMRALGIHIISREMALFEWSRQAGTPLFKNLSQNFLQKQP